MQNLHDDNHLDNLSRKAAENFEADQDMHSWEKLHSRLDAVMPEKKERKRRFIVIFFLFLLIGGGLTYSAIMMNSKPGDVAEQTDKTPGQPGTSDKTAGQDNEAARNNSDKNNGGGNDKNREQDKPVSGTDNTVADNTASTSTTTAPATADAPADSKPQSTIAANTIRKNNTPSRRNDKPLTKNSDISKRNQTVTVTHHEHFIVKGELVKKQDKPGQDKSVQQKPAQDSPTQEKSTEDKTIENKTSDKTQDTSNPETNNQSDPDKSDKPATEKPVADQQPPASETAKNTNTTKAKKDKAPRSRWEFGLTYAPDISTIKFAYTEPPGHNIGVTIGYNFSKRFAVQTGLIYTTKKYKVRGADYNPPKGYWTDYVKLETVTGECTMWDIPLNLRYNMAPRKKSNFFVSAGLSSYLMQKEDYNFFYYYNNNPLNRYRHMDTTRKHWMSVLNLSVAYERQLSRKFALQVEPFFKQPLSGIGFGDMKLNTTGVYFTLKYKPVSGR